MQFQILFKTGLSRLNPFFLKNSGWAGSTWIFSPKIAPKLAQHAKQPCSALSTPSKNAAFARSSDWACLKKKKWDWEGEIWQNIEPKFNKKYEMSDWDGFLCDMFNQSDWNIPIFWPKMWSKSRRLDPKEFAVSIWFFTVQQKPFPSDFFWCLKWFGLNRLRVVSVHWSNYFAAQT